MTHNEGKLLQAFHSYQRLISSDKRSCDPMSPKAKLQNPQQLLITFH